VNESEVRTSGTEVLWTELTSAYQAWQLTSTCHMQGRILKRN